MIHLQGVHAHPGIRLDFPFCHAQRHFCGTHFDHRQLWLITDFKFLALEMFADVLSCLVTCSDSLDHECCAGGSIACSEDARSAGREGIGIHSNGSTPGGANPAIFRDKCQASSLPDGEDHLVTI